MRTIYKIARTELQTLFYSPVAWMIIVLFTFQAAMEFVENFEGLVQTQAMGGSASFITNKLFASPIGGGLFLHIQGYLYLYIPLLTMGLMSRELGSGSIKLLYSSPITNTQIILAKFLSMMIYGLALIAVLFVFVLFAQFTVKDFDLPFALTGLLGLYLLICAYAAIGLFMSSLTSYQIVAAVSTLAMLTILSYVKNWWQEFELVREITYWISISGRSGEFIKGLICSEDVLYFIIVSALFLALAIIRLQAVRQKAPWFSTLGKFLGVFLIACVLGYLSSRPKLMGYYDATETKMNTLTPNSQKVIAQAKGDLTITAYSNIMDDRDRWQVLPKNIKRDQELFRQYIRFKPEIKMEYVYYYDTIASSWYDRKYPDLNLWERAKKVMEDHSLDSNMFISPQEIRSQINLLPEGNKFVRELKRGNGEKTFLRVFNDNIHHPTEAEITAALKRITQKLPKIGFLTGHRERSIQHFEGRDYFDLAWNKPARFALLNQGFDVEEVVLNQSIPEDISILVIAEMRTHMSADEKIYLDEYIAKGGNMFILSEPGRTEFMSPLLSEFGVKLIPGRLTEMRKYKSQDLSKNIDLIEVNDKVSSFPTMEGAKMIYHFDIMRANRRGIASSGIAGLDYAQAQEKGYLVTPLFVTDSMVWNELETFNYVDDTVRCNPVANEIQQSYTTLLALSRKVRDKEQRILISGDADCISNGGINTRVKGRRIFNSNIVTGGFFWLSNEEVPIDIRRPNGSDTAVYMGVMGMKIWSVILKWIIPIIFTVIAFIIWLRRRGR